MQHGKNLLDSRSIVLPASDAYWNDNRRLVHWTNTTTGAIQVYQHTLEFPDEPYVVAQKELKKIIKKSFNQAIPVNEVVFYLKAFFKYFTIFFRHTKAGTFHSILPGGELDIQEFANYVKSNTPESSWLDLSTLLSKYVQSQLRKSGSRPLTGGELANFLTQKHPPYSKILDSLQEAVTPRQFYNYSKCVDMGPRSVVVPPTYYNTTTFTLVGSSEL